MNIQPKCRPPVVWKAICTQCGKEVMRFCSKPHDNWKTGRLGIHELAYAHGKFSAHVDQIIGLNRNTTCCQVEHLELVSEKFTNQDLMLFTHEVVGAAEKAKAAARAVGQLRKYIESCKISPQAFETMYKSLEGIMNATGKLAQEKLNIQHFLKDVPDDVNF